MEKKKVPALRFRGFHDDWEQRKLSNVTEEFKSGTFIAADEIEENGEYPVYGGNGLRGYSDKYNHNGEFALIGRQGALCGNMNFSVGKAYFTEHAVAVKANGLSNTRFLYYLLDKMNLGQFSDHSAQPGLAVGKLIKLENMFPSKQEQDKIGGYFEILDNLITLHQRKYEKLQKLKKAMLEKMFPKPGCSVPEIRFQGFTDDWEQRKLGELASLITKGTTPLDKSNTGVVNFVKIESIDESSGNITITQKISLDEHNGYLRRSQLKENDILFSIAGTLGRVTSVNKSILPANTNQALAIIRLKDGYLDYVKTYLKGKAVADFIKKNPTIGAQPNLSLEQVANLEIAIPSVPEQIQIGAFFKHLDHLITLHQRKLEKLKNLKKACLEKMFV